MLPPMSVTYTLDRTPDAEDLRRLLTHTGWAADRDLAGVQRQIAATGIHATAWSGDRMIAYARVLTDGIYRALIDDVVVDPEFRGNGVGGELLRTLVTHLGTIEELHLICDDDVRPFYEGLGFAADDEENLMFYNP